MKNIGHCPECGQPNDDADDASAEVAGMSPPKICPPMIVYCPECGHPDHRGSQSGCTQCPCGSPEQANIAAAVAAEREACATLAESFDPLRAPNWSKMSQYIAAVIRARGEPHG